MKRFVFILLFSCSKIDIVPKIQLSPNPSQSNSYANILLDIPDTLKRYDKYISIHFIYSNSEERKVIKLANTNLYQLYLPESLINYSVYLIIDTFTIRLEGIRVYEGSKPKQNTFFISSKYEKIDSQKIKLLKAELENYPNNIKAKAYYDCLKNEKTDTSQIYELYYNICKNPNNYKNILKAIEYGDSSYEFLFKASFISDTILDIASKKFSDDMELQLLKLKKLNEKKRFNESIILSDFLVKNLNMEWLYKFYPHLNYKERRNKFFEVFSEIYKQKALAHLNLNDSVNYKKNFYIYCLNYPFVEKNEECKDVK
ncbi:MAG: hypothetical protein ABIL78_01585 [candidate division WOR-3 bacterium]